MITFTLAAVPFLIKLTGVIFVFVALCLILIILVQKGKGGGLGAAFGGAASSLLGTKTGDFLTWVTIGLASVLLLIAIILGRYRPTVTALEETAPAPVQQQQQSPAAGGETGQQMPAQQETVPGESGAK